LNVNRRSYYKWSCNGKHIINNFDDNLLKIISVEHEITKKTYGTIRLKKHIENKYGLVLNHKLIRRYKQAFNIDVIVRKHHKMYIKAAKEKNLKNKAPYIIDCNFTSEKPLQKLSSDVSYIKCIDGTLYLSAVKDLFNNEIISFNTSNRNNTELIIKSYKNISKANDDSYLINTDQGSVYLAYEYIKYMEKIGYTRSMSNRGHCWENCPIENWFSQLKEESIRPLGKMTRKQVAIEIKKYVKWYNTQRIQKKLGYLFPHQYKLNYKN
jgi:transposase InsO family protein